jgi:hypothetical protein
MGIANKMKITFKGNKLTVGSEQYEFPSAEFIHDIFPSPDGNLVAVRLEETGDKGDNFVVLKIKTFKTFEVIYQGNPTVDFRGNIRWVSHEKILIGSFHEEKYNLVLLNLTNSSIIGFPSNGEYMEIITNICVSPNGTVVVAVTCLIDASIQTVHAWNIENGKTKKLEVSTFKKSCSENSKITVNNHGKIRLVVV